MCLQAPAGLGMLSLSVHYDLYASTLSGLYRWSWFQTRAFESGSRVVQEPVRLPDRPPPPVVRQAAARREPLQLLVAAVGRKRPNHPAERTLRREEEQQRGSKSRW